MADQTNSTAFRDYLADLADNLFYRVTLHSAITGLTLNMTYAATGISELATVVNGYTLGGQAVPLVHTGGNTGNLDSADIVWTNTSGADLGPVTYAVVWANTTDTITGAKAIAIKDSSVTPQTATDGNTMTFAVVDMIAIPTPA